MRDFQEMRDYVNFTDADVVVLKKLAPVVAPHLPALAERFYSEIPRHPTAYSVFTGPEQIERLKLSLQRWGKELFSGTYDEEYVRQRHRIGHIHVRIQLPQRFVISAMALVREFLHEVINRDVQDLPLRMQAHTSINKILDIDLNLMCEAYFTASLQSLTEVNDELEEANRRLRETSQVKTEFLARTSHELRTPLSSILGFIRLVLDGVCQTREEEMDLLNDAFQAAEHLLLIVNDLLDVARIEAGKLEVRLQPFEVAPVLKQVFALVGMQAEQKSILLEDRTDAPSLPSALGDPERFKQVLINLVGNAVKFTDSGQVTIFGKRLGEEFLEFEVQDTGVGIAEEKQAGLFEQYKQVDSLHTRRHGGSGLGLVISKHLVERMGGQIRLQSKGLGAGTTVAFTIPVYRK